MERGRCWFVTSTGADKDVIPLLFRGQCKYIVYSQDISDNGTEHVHMFISFATEKSQDQVRECIPEQYRYAIQYCERSINKQSCIKYIEKKQLLGFVPKALGDVPEHLRHLIEKKTLKGRKRGHDSEPSCYQKLQNKEYANREECIADFKERESKTYTLSYGNVMTKIDKAYPVTPYTKKYQLSDFNVPPLDFSNMKSKVLIGPTSLGKTQFAKAHFNNPVRVTIKQDLSDINENTDGLIIDDLTFCKNNPLEFLHLLDMRESTSTRVLYGRAYIPEGMPRIFTANSEEVFWPEGARPETSDAYLKRCEVIHYHSKLYGVPEIPIKWKEDGPVKKKKRTDPLRVGNSPSYTRQERQDGAAEPQ